MATTRVLDRQVMAGARIALKVQHILRTRSEDMDVITQMAATNVTVKGKGHGEAVFLLSLHLAASIVLIMARLWSQWK